MTHPDRYRAVGLKGNPFVAQQIQGERVAPVGKLFVSRNLPDPPPPGSRTLVQVIGDPGMGKSTHLEWWRSKHPGPLHYVPNEPYKARWKQPPLVKAGFKEAMVYGDEIDRMPSPLRTRWFRHLSQRRATLVIGTHDDLTRVGERSGFDVTTHHLDALDLETLIEIVECRLAAFSTGENSDVLFTIAELEGVLAESGGNPREAEALCHRLLATKVDG